MEACTGMVTNCLEFWRTFVRGSVVMEWIEHNYALLRTAAAPAAREKKNSHSALEHHEFVLGAVATMLAENAVTELPPGEKPAVVSPLGVVHKRGTNKFHLITVNMRYVNRHLEKRSSSSRDLRT